MTYTGDRLIIGQGTVSGTDIDRWFTARGPGYAAYAPDGRYKAAPAIGDSIAGYARLWGVNSDLVAGQVMHESAGWQSKYSRLRNNPSGLGAINSAPDEALSFATPDMGIRATVAHLCDYAIGKGNWTQYDPRYAAMVEAGDSVGRAPTLNGLDQRWAWTDPAVYNATPANQRYGASIAALANDLVAFAKQTGGAVPFEMPDNINGIPLIKRFIPTKNSNRPGTPATASGQQWITVHETANTAVGADAKMHNTFVYHGGGADPATDNEGVSFTFVVDDHSIYQNLPLEEKSWQASDGSNGDGNSSVSIETCVNADGDWTKTKANLANLVAFLATHVPNKSMDRVAQHHRWARDGKNCPTRLRANGGAEWDALIATARGIAVGGVVIPPAGGDPVTGKYIATEFQTYYDANGGIDVFGRPISGAFIEDGRKVQYFEGNELQHFPENAGTKYEVQRRLLGTEELARRYPTGAPA